MPVRASVDLYFDSGDGVKTGNLGIPMSPDPVWAGLQALRCTASVIGNRETHLAEGAFKAKLAGHAHPVLCANLADKSGDAPLPGHLIVQVCALRIGVIGVSVPMVTSRMQARHVSAYLWAPPIETAVALARRLRPEVDLLVALTHIGLSNDRKLAEACPEVDVVFGGHSHSVLDEPEYVGGTPICQGGSHGRFYGTYAWDAGTLTGGLSAWPA